MLLAVMERGCDAQLFSSGMAAVVAVFQALEPGDRVILPESVYYGVRKWALEYAGPWGLKTQFIPNEDPAALEVALRGGKTKFVWIETPSNPDWRITDIKLFSQIAHDHGALVIVDNTVATPVLTRPLELGADFVMHSCTKYLNGHGDVLAGALVSKENSPLWRRIKGIAHDAGNLPGTFEAWLLLRGMRTLFLRMEKISSNAMAIAEHFSNHPKVEAMLYPGLAGSRGHKVAASQMQGGFGGMLSLTVHGGREAAVKIQSNVRLFKRATSFGSTESFIEHRSSYEGPQTLVADNLLRFSIGIENCNDLINDLKTALDD
jgi:cystathionine gamma-synthase